MLPRCPWGGESVATPAAPSGAACAAGVGPPPNLAPPTVFCQIILFSAAQPS